MATILEEERNLMRNAIKDSTAKCTIEGLTKSGEHYEEAVKCLKSRYDHPRLIHQAHVRRILEAPTLKDGSGKELRLLHDLVIQHLRALKAMGHEPSNAFITSMLELELDITTMFEWHWHTQDHTDVPDCRELLEFLNLRARAAKASSSSKRKPLRGGPPARFNSSHKLVTAFVSNTLPVNANCILCKVEKHPLYSCSKFKDLAHRDMVALLKSNNCCLNCLQPGHFVKECKSLHHCKRCQKPHHTLLHVETKTDPPPTEPLPAVANHASVKLRPDLLLMTCQVMIKTLRGSVKARALLDSASSTSFVFERLAQSLRLQHHPQIARICGIAGLSHGSRAQSLTNFKVSSVHSSSKKFDVNAIVVPQATCDLPVHPITPTHDWKHLDGLRLADPDFSEPGRVDLLLGIETFVEVVRQGRRKGGLETPTAIETEFGWVLAGSTHSANSGTVVSHHASVLSGDDLLRQFWDVEEKPVANSTLTPEERLVMKHFDDKHTRTAEGRFMVPLPKRSTMLELGESRSQAVRRFASFERSLHAKGLFGDFEKVIEEYFHDHHAERVAHADLEKSPREVFYLLMHVVRKESSTTTELRAMFDASAKTSTGTSLNDTLLVGPTVHPPLVDVLTRFRSFRIALIADVSCMFRVILLSESDKDLHRFVWRSDPKAPLVDYRMTRLTFGISSSSFIANMCLKQNASDFALSYPEAAKVVEKSFYVDDCLTESDSIEGAIKLQRELQELFSEGGFLLRKWNSNEPSVLKCINPELRDAKSILSL